MHSQVVVGQNIRRPVHVVERQLHGGHHALAHGGPGSAGRGGEEAGNVDVVLVVAVSVGVELLANTAPQQVGGQARQAQGRPGEQQEPHRWEVRAQLMVPILTPTLTPSVAQLSETSKH